MVNNLVYIIIFFSCLVAVLNNPANALFCLAGCYFISSILLLVLNVEFLALVLISIYLGALLVLFLFILMLSNVKECTKTCFSLANQALSLSIIFFSIFFILKFLNLMTLISFQAIYNFEQSYIFYFLFESDIDCFIFLYTDFFVWFFLTSLVLFISVLSSLFLLIKS